jgi:hypothetical protein
MIVELRGYICVNDGDNYSLQCIIDDIKETKLDKGYVEQYPFYAVEFEVTKDD